MAIFLLGIGSCLPGFGQSSDVTVGVRAGLNVASANSSSITKLYEALNVIGGSTKISPLLGIHAGVIIQKKWSQFSLQSEILFSQYGVKIEKGLQSAEFKSNVLELPVFGKYTGGHGRAKFFLYAGPFLNYALNGQYQVTAQLFSLPVRVTDRIHFQDTNERISWGISSGAGIDWAVGTGHLVTEIRYGYSLQSKLPSQVIGLGGTNIHARLAAVSMGYLFPMR
ncbi:hypothetical protein GCM10028805_41800 [Spirosoma harenae]